jgi:CBS domain-containing protein
MKEKYEQIIGQASELTQLRQIREQLQHELISQRLLGDMDAMVLLNTLFDAVYARVVELTEHIVSAKHGLAKAPVPYAFLFFGSAGRCEQTIGSDQDNGLIYQSTNDPQEAERNDQFFADFADQLTEHIIHLGFAECSGRVLCKEAQWRKSEKQWYAQMLAWMQDPSWEHVRYLLILADGRVVCGDSSLYNRLKQQYLDYVRDHPTILQAMLRNTLHRKVLIGLFGNLIREQFGEAQGGVDIKYGAYVPFVNAIRLLAIRHHQPVSSTVERIAAMREANQIDEQLAERWLHAFQGIMSLRAQTFLQEHESLFVSEGKLKASQMTPQMIRELKEYMKVTKQLQLYTRKTISRETGGSWN